MSNVYIITKENKKYSKEGIIYLKKWIQNDFHDNTDLHIEEGVLINKPQTLAKLLSRSSDPTYIFVSHDKGIDLIHSPKNIKAFIDLLNDPANKDKTSWSIIMKNTEDTE